MHIDKEIKLLDKEHNTTRVAILENNTRILHELQPIIDELHPIMIERYIRAERNQYKRQQKNN